MKEIQKPRWTRPFELQDREKFAELIRQHGIRGAQRVSEVPICCGTLIKIAREFGISLQIGKRKKAA